MKTVNDSRRGSVEVVIMACLVGALVLALGWIFWQNFSKNDDTKTDDIAQTSDVTKSDEVTTDSETAKTDTKKPATKKASTMANLKIKEWGVQFPYDTAKIFGADTLTYTTLDKDSSTIDIRPNAKKYLSGGSCDGGVYGYVSRGKASDKMTAPGYSKTYGDLYKSGDAGRVGKYYFAQGYIGPGGCSDKNQTLYLENLSDMIGKFIVKVEKL